MRRAFGEPAAGDGLAYAACIAGDGEYGAGAFQVAEHHVGDDAPVRDVDPPEASCHVGDRPLERRFGEGFRADGFLACVTPVDSPSGGLDGHPLGWLVGEDETVFAGRDVL